MTQGCIDTDVSGLRHHAFVYDADDEYVQRSVAFLRTGLQAGEAAIVAGTRPPGADARGARR